MPKAVIIGATSGIGWAVAVEMAKRGYTIGAAGRREELLHALRQKIPAPIFTRQLDVTQTEQAVERLHELIDEMGGMDVIVISSGVGIHNPTLEWAPERQTIAVNVTGFTAMAVAAFRYFEEHGGGAIAGISSVAAERGNSHNPAYGASKAFVSSYMEGLRGRGLRSRPPIYVTDIRPGFVDTPMTRGQQGMFWLATPEHAARHIVDAIEQHKRRAYITPRWAFAAWLMRHIPAWLWDRYA